jgi:hypothetical protein
VLCNIEILKTFNVCMVFNKTYFMYLLEQEEFEDTKGVIRIRKSTNRQHNGQRKKNKRTNNDRQNIHIKKFFSVRKLYSNSLYFFSSFMAKGKN